MFGQIRERLRPGFKKQRTCIQADDEILVKQMAIGFEKPRKQDEDKSRCYYCS